MDDLTLLLLLFWPIFLEVPTVLFIAFWFGIQLLSGTAALLGPQQVGGIAWWAHIGGFVAGVALHRLFVARSESFKPADWSNRSH